MVNGEKWYPGYGFDVLLMMQETFTDEELASLGMTEEDIKAFRDHAISKGMDTENKMAADNEQDRGE